MRVLLFLLSLLLPVDAFAQAPALPAQGHHTLITASVDPGERTTTPIVLAICASS